MTAEYGRVIVTVWQSPTGSWPFFSTRVDVALRKYGVRVSVFIQDFTRLSL
jgi:hypothetical protein